MLTVALPNKGALSEGVTTMLAEAGYRSRPDGRDLTVVDPGNAVRFYFLRPRDVAVYVGSGDVDLGVTGRDLALDSGAPVREVLSLGIGGSRFRYAAPPGPGGAPWTMADLAGRRIATSYAGLVSADLAGRGIEATIVRLDGAVEISVELGVADAVADVVGTGRTLAAHGLVAFGDVLCTSEAVAVERDPDRAGGPAPGPEDDGRAGARRQLLRRLEGVAVAQQYVMVDYDCPRHLVEEAVALTPGLESPTIAPLRDEAWVAVRALVPKGDMNHVIDALADLGAKAILASDLRSARL
ncbi:MAG TPA: ATP phosphoribosyltransferase [Acidimicrobiales bacterium]|nr:ATP phosphoribosyltransferase [Acidimicrobiales bacterium]